MEPTFNWPKSKLWPRWKLTRNNRMHNVSIPSSPMVYHSNVPSFINILEITGFEMPWIIGPLT
jgi:hypothetical protein